MVMTMIDEALPQPVRRGGQAEDLEMRVVATQGVDHAPIARVLVQRDPMTLIDHQQRKGAMLAALCIERSPKASRLRTTDCTEPNTTCRAARLLPSPALKMSASSP